MGDDTARRSGDARRHPHDGHRRRRCRPGRYRGKVIDDATTTQPRLWLGHARYEFHGRAHWFVADLHITENDGLVPITATIQGIVTRGWLKGAHVTGQYREWDTCPIPTPGNVLGTTCFQGTLHLQR